MSAPDVAPGFGQIPLPAGMSLEEYLTLQGQIGMSIELFFSTRFTDNAIFFRSVTIAITAAVATGILLWD